MKSGLKNFYCAGCGNLHQFSESQAERLVYILAERLVTGGAGLPMRVIGNRLETVVCLRATLEETSYEAQTYETLQEAINEEDIENALHTCGM